MVHIVTILLDGDGCHVRYMPFNWSTLKRENNAPYLSSDCESERQKAWTPQLN
jgi:hypothetical protein